MQENIGRFSQSTHDLKSVGRLEIDRDSALTHIDLLMNQALAIRPHRPSTRVIPVRRFHLDHIGAQLGQDHGGPGAGDIGGEVDDAKTL